MLLMRILLILFTVNFMTAAWAESTARLRGPKEFDTPAVTRLGPLSAQDTLWRLAEQARPDKRVNMYQMMFALYQRNPDAFLDDNFNHLKPGAFLEVPGIRDILAIDPVMAQRKSENDDRVWAEKIRKAAQLKPEDHSAKQVDIAKAQQEITDELNRVEAQQTEQMSDLRDRLGASMANVETIVQENTALKKQLDTVVSELSNVKQQLDKDSEIQTQLQQLLQQQTEMLEQQREQIRKQQEGFNFAETWQNLANSPAGWILAAALPAALVLFGVVLLIRRKSKKAAAAVSAATASPALDPNYKSPLPPLDDSLDFDESSLINLDDSLLNDNLSSGIRLDDDFDRTPARKPAMASFDDDDLLDDHLDLGSDNSKTAGAFGLDDLLDDPLEPPPAPAKAEPFDPDNILSGDALSNLLDADEPAFEAKQAFDPNNILSGNELSSLFDNLADDDDDPDAIFNQALAAQQAKPEVTAEAEPESDLLTDPQVSAAALAFAAAEAAESDELLEEIELDLPGEEPVATSAVALDDDDFDIDALVAQTQAGAGAAAAEPVAAAPLPADDSDDFDIDALLDMTQATEATVPVSAEVESEAPQQAFDSSELEAFAESLAEEQLAVEQTVEDLPVTASEEEALEAAEAFESDELLAADDESGLLDELDEILNEVAEIRAQSQQAKQSLQELELPEDAVTQASADIANAELSLADFSAMLTEPSAEDEPAEAELAPAAVAAAEADAAPADDFIDIEELMLEDGAGTEIEAELAAETAAETEYLSEFAGLEEMATEMPDLGLSDDNSVARVYEGISSVERPSKVLDEYPDLQLDDAEQAAIFPEELIDTAEEPALTAEQSELHQLDDVNFDELLSGLDEFASPVADPLADQHKAAEVLAELEQLQQSQSRYSPETEPVELPDFVNIDKLLAATEDQLEPDAELKTLNIDVGLADFEDLIAADEVGDVDHADGGFAGQLDLVRAYIEIGDADSANHLIKEIMASEAPAHVKQEAAALLS
ncbi:FimV/HubP family polar landmark protein [Rheinheimera texasensis]|uniref:FimV/HubP family polar landmark protein n=1 Tax=Rheinheimera texasensis TaxID=306205 RepID=UPI0004E11F5D|nr:FimV/HubP family polar landmark protein [Rheinheimera texasensis]